MNCLRPPVGFYSSIVFDSTVAIQNGFKYLNTDTLSRFAIKIIFADFENFPTLEIDTLIFETKDFAAIERFNREISIRRKKIADLLLRSINEKLDIPTNINDSDVSIYYANINRLPSIKKIIKETISPALLSDDYAICGGSLLLNLPSSYIIAKDGEDLQSLLMRAVRKRNLLQSIKNEQELSGVARDSFKWSINSFLVPLRQLYADRIKEIISSHQFIFGEFDISMQLLMHLGAYGIEDVWNIPKDLMSQLSQSTIIEACAKFEQMVTDGIVSPNDSLVLGELFRLADELDEHLSGLSVNIGNARINLPSFKMCNMACNPFTDSGAHTELVLTKREFIDSPNGKIMIVREKLSGRKVIFSPIQPEISSLYSRGFCNLHYANPGEIAVYGAFVEGEELPFAYSSYSRISYNYTREMLSYLGFADDEIIESSRAWNAIWAPENTMSVLFSYSQNRLKEMFRDEILGILTSINPNLGFSASAFRGIHFEIASLKPTVFSYQLINDRPYFKSKGEIAKNLGVEVSNLINSEYYTENKTPFLPTVELLYLYDKNERRKLSESPIYTVSRNDYLHNR